MMGGNSILAAARAEVGYTGSSNLMGGSGGGLGSLPPIGRKGGLPPI